MYGKFCCCKPQTIRLLKDEEKKGQEERERERKKTLWQVKVLTMKACC